MKWKSLGKMVAWATLLVFAAFVPAWGHGPTAGAVYTMSNSPTGNEILVFHRSFDGSLSPAGVYSTDGLGTGTGLGNQGGVVLSDDHRWLFAVNAGSDEISVFAVKRRGLKLMDVANSGGQHPVSLTFDRGLLYVLNAGGSVGSSDNITAFWVSPHGKLFPLPGSSRPLSAPDTGPAQIEFRPDGAVLVVTEKGTNRIDTYTVDGHGLAHGPKVFPSSGATPFGFAFGKRGQMFVSEAFGGTPDASAVSSYRVFRNGMLQVTSPSVGTNQTAACWVVVTKSGRFAYTTNFGSNSISGYQIHFDGTISLLDADGRTGETGAGPIDMAFSGNGRYLYTLNSGDGTISSFRVGPKGELISLAVSAAEGLPPAANGLAAR